MNKKIKTVISVFLILGVITVMACSVAYIGLKKMREREKREDLVWLARCELETLRNDKEVLYLRLKDINYKDNYLNLKFDTSVSFDEVIEKSKDSLMYQDLMSVIVLNLNKWEKVSQYLTEAQVDLNITYSNNIVEFPFTISYNQLADMVSDKQLFDEGLEIFVRRKKQEVLEYARSHFRNDRYFKVDSLHINNDFVSLCMTYDDTKAELGRTFLDPNNVPMHFTDKVGEMGSILNNMLSICARIDRGFAFVYTAKKSRKIQSCRRSAEKAKEIYEDTVGKLWLDNRSTNRVRTMIYQVKSQN